MFFFFFFVMRMDAKEITGACLFFSLSYFGYRYLRFRRGRYERVHVSNYPDAWQMMRQGNLGQVYFLDATSVAGFCTGYLDCLFFLCSLSIFVPCVPLLLALSFRHEFERVSATH